MVVSLKFLVVLEFWHSGMRCQNRYNYTAKNNIVFILRKQSQAQQLVRDKSAHAS